MNLPETRDGAFVYLVKGDFNPTKLTSPDLAYWNPIARTLREQGIPVLLPNKQADGLYQGLVDTLFHKLSRPEAQARAAEVTIVNSQLLGWAAFPLVIQQALSPKPDAFPETTAIAQVAGKTDRER